MNRRQIIAALVLILLSAVRFATAEDAKSSLTGEVRRVGGLRVLTLTGSARENGYAHGYLLADEIMSLVNDFILSLPAVEKIGGYAKVVELVERDIKHEKPRCEELDGMLEGMRAKLGGAGLRIPRLDRPITAADLWVLNSVGEWNRFFCSSFSAWGTMTAGGQNLTGRNLDYQGRRFAERMGTVFVRKQRDPSRKSWVGIGFAGEINCSSGINQDGVVILLHDSGATGKPDLPAFARSFALRECIETVSPAGNLAENVAGILRRHNLYRGGNVHVTSPSSPAAVIEMDGNSKLGKGVTVRLAAAGQDWIANTNHFRERSRMTKVCPRYAALEKELGAMAGEGRRVRTMEDAWKIIAKAAVGQTLSTMVFSPSERKMLVSVATVEKPAQWNKPVLLDANELLGIK
jgi:hypothetical protein